MPHIRFTTIKPRCDRRHWVSEDDVRTVLSRLPPELLSRLASVHFNDRGGSRRTLGYVNFGFRAISLCALPPRVSLTPYLHRHQSPATFGALRGCQWPPLAVRRYMLYNVLLHELGHLQPVAKYAKNPRLSFAGETLAQRFADRWRKELWSRPFAHDDPVHNPPTAAELQDVAQRWRPAHEEYKRKLRKKAPSKTT